MIQLCNLSTYEDDLRTFDRDGKILHNFLHEHDLAGLELLIDQPWEERIVPRHLIKGVHLRYWSNWLDFWLGDRQQLVLQFGNEANIVKHYGGADRAILVENYRAEIQKAIATGAEYAVLHVSNARFGELFTYDFGYSDEQVINGTIELVNAVMDGIKSNITILFENLWWPGLTLCDAKLAARLLEKVNHPYKGFMLDTGHLMNTNTALRTQQEGINYILATLKKLGELKEAIQGIHLHSSLSGKYVLRTIKTADGSFDKNRIMAHILQIDQHRPFEHPDVHRIVDYIQPRYLVHEFTFRCRAELSQYISTQQAALQGNILARGEVSWNC
ncbi:TIM barrel protein [Sporolituus thermophilus]|uniref:TIM barrel protein n=1 Tax=Sporolituus thermophilus TaxID=608505 RepID=UPI0014959EAE|nr:TIM barrel protein [Sporolituus thermophilus]